MLDLAAQDAAATTLSELERMHAGKTGALFAASAELGAITAGTSAAVRDALAEFGMAIGVAFQFADDLDDGDFAHLAEAARARRAELGEVAKESLAVLARHGADTRLLAEIAAWFAHA
jgi:hypothetical protein